MKNQPIILPLFINSKPIQQLKYDSITLIEFVVFSLLLPPLVSQSHLPIELEQGTLGLNAIRPTNEILPDAANVVVNAVHSTDSQMIPSHLKCGMWASLALATVFLAGVYGVLNVCCKNPNPCLDFLLNS